MNRASLDHATLSIALRGFWRPFGGQPRAERVYIGISGYIGKPVAIYLGRYQLKPSPTSSTREADGVASLLRVLVLPRVLSRKF